MLKAIFLPLALAVCAFLCGWRIRGEKEESKRPKTKAEEIKVLADDMYDAAQYLSTDASRLRKAMENYHKYIAYHYREN